MTMGRRSLQAERRREILTACEEIILTEGLAAATPTRVASEIGLDRTTVHHYFSTRADLITGLAERMVDAYLAELVALRSERTGVSDPLSVLDRLLSPDFKLPRYDRLIDEFAAAAHRDDTVREQLARLYRTLESAAVDAMLAAMPECNPTRVRETAYALYALIEGALLLRAQGFPKNRLAAVRRTARRLIEDLTNEARAADDERPSRIREETPWRSST